MVAATMTTLVTTLRDKGGESAEEHTLAASRTEG
jgi:hypothetical protein